MIRPPESTLSMTLVAGGTGGHILPAIAFGDWLRREKPHVRVNYMSGSRPMELDIYRSLKIEPFVVRASGSPMGTSGARVFKRWAELGTSFTQALGYFRVSRPDMCVMFGGYVSAPVMAAGLIKRVRSILHEQNACAGRVARAAEKLRVPIASGWEVCEHLKYSSYRCVGVPVRKFRDIPRSEAWGLLGMDAPDGDGPVVSVMTGSLGSGRLSETLAELTKLDVFSRWKFFIVDPETKTPARAGTNVTRLPRMWDITPLYAVSDILITRGGASTLSEVEALGIPAVAAPWRKAADDHQMKNAAHLASKGKIAIWDENGDSLEDLSQKLQNLYAVFCGKKGYEAKMLYNAREAGEKNCRRLWDFAADFWKGEVDLEGGSLH